MGWELIGAGVGSLLFGWGVVHEAMRAKARPPAEEPLPSDASRMDHSGDALAYMGDSNTVAPETPETPEGGRVFKSGPDGGLDDFEHAKVGNSVFLYDQHNPHDATAYAVPAGEEGDFLTPDTILPIVKVEGDWVVCGPESEEPKATEEPKAPEGGRVIRRSSMLYGRLPEVGGFVMICAGDTLAQGHGRPMKELPTHQMTHGGSTFREILPGTDETWVVLGPKLPKGIDRVRAVADCFGDRPEAGGSMDSDGHGWTPRTERPPELARKEGTRHILAVSESYVYLGGLVAEEEPEVPEGGLAVPAAQCDRSEAFRPREGKLAFLDASDGLWSHSTLQQVGSAGGAPYRRVIRYDGDMLILGEVEVRKPAPEVDIPEVDIPEGAIRIEKIEGSNAEVGGWVYCEKGEVPSRSCAVVCVWPADWDLCSVPNANMIYHRVLAVTDTEVICAEHPLKVFDKADLMQIHDLEVGGHLKMYENDERAYCWTAAQNANAGMDETLYTVLAIRDDKVVAERVA